MQLYTDNPLCLIAENEDPDQVKSTHVVYRRNMAGESEGRVLTMCTFKVDSIFQKNVLVNQGDGAFMVDVGLPV